MGTTSDSQAASRYQIRVLGQLDLAWSDWFSGLVIRHESAGNGPSMTILTGIIADQAALRGILGRLWDLNLILYSVQQLESRETPGT